MSDPITRLNAALEGRYAIERELGEGGMANVLAFVTRPGPTPRLRHAPNFQATSAGPDEPASGDQRSC